MSARRLAKLGAYRVAQMSGAVPTVWMLRNPFKIHEYVEVVSGAGLAPGHAVLDLGCGKGFQTQIMARSCGRVIGLDVSPAKIAEARRFLEHSCVERKVEFIAGKIEEAGLPAESLDRVVSFCVLEHIPNLDRVLQELVRLLKPGGEMHVSVDALASIRDPELLARHRREHFVVEYFTPESLRARLSAAGFEVTEIRPIMTGEFARAQFEARIRVSDFTHGLFDRVRFYRRLKDDDRRSGSRDGIMLVARARKPASNAEKAEA
jgi:ubiquinone/menaquinone biosynthesis C-methylase UbiE